MEMPEGFIQYEKQINEWIDSHKGAEKPIAGMAAQNVLGLLRLIKEMAESLELSSYNCLSRNPEDCGVTSCVDRLKLLKKFKEWK